MISSIVSRLVILVFGTLYPAYASYKAVRSRDVREYVKWMMYWIVFALFTCGETITDVFLSFWFPFYYEIKIGFVLWLLSPATKGSSILYRKFVHPMLTNREQEIDEYLARAKEQGYHTVLHLGSKGVNYATNVIMQTAIKGGGGLVNQLRKSYSLSDLTEGEGEPVGDVNRNGKDVDGLEYRGNRRSDRVDGSRSSNRARGYSPRRSASGSARMEMYFPEVDLEVRQRRGSSKSREPSVPLSHIRSSEDVSYMSGNHFYEDASQMDTDQTIEESVSLSAAEGPLVRTASVGSTRSMRTKGTVPRASATSTAAKKAAQGEVVEVSSSEEEDFWSDPVDEIPPVLDRTIFVNNQNISLTHIPQVAVTSIVSSAAIYLPIDIELDTSEPLSNSSGALENEKVGIEGLTKSQLVEDIIPSTEVSCSQIANDSEVSDNCVPEKVHPDLNEKTDVLESSKISDGIPSFALNDNNDKILESPNNLASEEGDTESSMTVITEISTGEPSLSESISSQNCSASSSTDSETLVISEVKGGNDESQGVDNSSNAPTSTVGATVENATFSEEIKVSTHKLTDGDSSVTVNEPVRDKNKSAAGDENEHKKIIPSCASTVSKEEQHADRGGRYHKPPAPRPPQLDGVTQGETLEPEERCGEMVRARLVLKPGIVRSLPDVTKASDNLSVRSEVFMAARYTPWSRLSSTPSPCTSPKPGRKSKHSGITSKNKPNKETESSGFPRFLRMSGRPHLGSLTSVFPFWHGSASSASGNAGTDGKGGKKSAVDAGGTEVGPGDEAPGTMVSGGGDVTGREFTPEKQFPIRRMSHSPTRYRLNRRV